MADIFISYAREDRPAVEQLAAALKAAGLTCWWDKQLAAGQVFLEETERELNAAKAVLVVWTKHSIGSHWVHDEAGAGRDTGRLAPISLDGSTPPLGFRQFQVIDFAPWAKGDDSPVRELIEALARFAPEAAITQTTRPAPKPANKRILAGIAAVIALVVAGVMWKVMTPAAKPASPQLAVLRFQNIGVVQPYFSDGVADELATELSRVEGLVVLSRASSFTLRDEDASPAGAAEKLGATLVLSGTVQKIGDNIRVTAQLADAPGGKQIMAESFERPADQAFALQRAIAVKIARAINISITDVPTAGLSENAYALNLEGRIRYLNARDVPDFLAARDLFKSAVALEPDFARAWAGLALSESDLIFNENYFSGTAPSAERASIGLDAAEKAIALDPSDRDAYDAKGCILVTLGKWQEALQTYNKANTLGSGYGGDWLFFSIMGFTADSLAEAKDSVRRDPLSIRQWTNLVSICSDAGDVKCTLESSARARELDPQDSTAFAFRLFALMNAEDHDGARKLIKENKAMFDEYMAPGSMDADFLAWELGDAPPVPVSKILDAVKAEALPRDTATQMLVEMKEWDEAALLLDQWGPTERPSLSYLYMKDWTELRKRPEYWRLLEREGIVPFWRDSGKWPDFCRTDAVCKQRLGG